MENEVVFSQIRIRFSLRESKPVTDRFHGPNARQAVAAADSIGLTGTSGQQKRLAIRFQQDFFGFFWVLSC
jgi:hypothetical protein